MKRLSLKWLAIGTFGLLSTLPLMSLAMGHSEQGPAQMVGRLVDHLDLSASQEAQVRTLLEESHEKSAADKEHLKELKEALSAMTTNFDAGEAQLIATEIGAITGRTVFIRASVHAEIYALLTDEQRELLQEMLESREMMHKKFSGRRGNQGTQE